MWRTIVHQTYLRNIAVDTSGCSNNGVPIQVTPTEPGFLFDRPGSRISIRPAATLTGLGAIRVAVRFTLAPRGAPHRFNLAEGFESFALFVNDDFSLSGTILDEDSNWTGVSTAAGVVSPGATHSVGLECDGVNAVQLLLDGVSVAESYDTIGAVRDVGPLGLAVGHWPDAPNQYTFEGTIFEFLLQKYDPRADLVGLLDPCCVDPAALRSWLRALAKRGVTQGQLAQAGQSLRAVNRRAELAARGGTKAGTLRQRAMAKAVTMALRRKDMDALERALTQWRAATDLNSDTTTALGQQFQRALDEYGLTASDWSALMDLLCLGISSRGCGNGRQQ